MNRYDAKEAAEIVDRMMVNLATCIPTQGRAGSDARVAIGYVRANAFTLLMADAIGPPLDEAFDLTFSSGANLEQIEAVRVQVELEQPRSPGAVLLTQAGMNFCLATEGRIIAAMTFVSREDVERIKQRMIAPFANAEEVAADEMDSMTFQALIGLHATITNHLVKTALPLPRLLAFQFFEPLPSLVQSYRLYSDASRADEMRDANKVVHPAFCPLTGEGLSV
jgi:hypothetical protein